MVTNQMNVEELDQLLASGKLAALSSRLDALLATKEAAPSDTAAHVRRLRAELARRGEGPLVDLVVYARERLEGHAEDAPHLATAAARRLTKLGALQTAAKLLAQLGADHFPAEAADDELTRGELRATEIAALLDAHDFAAAATRLDEAATTHGDSDQALELRVAAALAHWSSGEAARARELLHRLTEDTRNATSLAARRAHAIARDMLTVLEADSSASPRQPSWTFAAATATAAAPADSTAPAASLAHLRAVLGGPSVRIVLSEAQIGAILEAGCSLYLEEERSTSTGIVRVAGFEATGRVLLIEDHATRAPSLVSADEQWRRCELHGRSALISGGELARLELGDDPRLAAIDACLRGDDGAAPPQAFIVTTMESAVRADDALPLAYKLLGNAYLRRVTSSNGDLADVYGWYARARERFLRAEWPLQIYAQALELEGRLEEAAVAWSQAAARDPRDDANIFGEARMVARLGWERHAERLIRRAVTLRPDLSVGYARMANLARGAGRLDEARVAAEIAAEMDPSAVESWLTLASVCEAQGSSHEADHALAKAIASDETLAWPRIRMARRFAVAGRWAEARAAAEGALAADKASPLSWHALAASLWGAGDAEGAFRALLAGIERSSDDQLAPEAARLVAVAWRGEDATRRIDELLAMTAGSPNAVADIARMLQLQGHDAAALRVLESAVEASSGALSTSWWLLQGLLRVREPSDAQRLRTTTLAASLFARASHFPPLVVLRACQLLESDPVEALAFIERLDATIAPAALWELAARALDHLGRADDATQLRSRIARTLPDGAVDAAALLAPIGRHDLARDLLVRAEQAAPGRPAVLAWLAASLCALGDPSAATDRYLACGSLRPEDLPVVPAMRAARDASRWDVVEAMARRAFGNVENDSCIMDDPWEAAGARAGAMLARGDESGRDELLARAGRHPDALEALVRIEKKIGSPHFDRDLALLLRVAPGTRVTNHEEHAS